MLPNRVYTIIATLALTIIAALTVRAAVATASLTAAERGRDADAARWNAAAEHYTELAARERAHVAETARWTGLAAYYGASVVNARALDAEAARWTGLAQHYAELEARAELARVALAAGYTGRAITAYVETGDAELLPNCMSAEVLAQLPSIGDDGWRNEVAACGE